MCQHGSHTCSSTSLCTLQDKFFRPYSGSLVRLVLLCAAIHQAVFTMLSTIKFAVGQVQDVGLIFLSAIASRCAALCRYQVYVTRLPVCH